MVSSKVFKGTKSWQVVPNKGFEGAVHSYAKGNLKGISWDNPSRPPVQNLGTRQPFKLVDNENTRNLINNFKQFPSQTPTPNPNPVIKQPKTKQPNMLQRWFGLGANVSASSKAYPKAQYLGTEPRLNRATNPNQVQRIGSRIKSGWGNFLDDQANNARQGGGLTNWVKSRYNQIKGNYNQRRTNRRANNIVRENDREILRGTPNYSPEEIAQKRAKAQEIRQGLKDSGTGGMMGRYFNSYLNLAEFSRPRLTLGCF